jgi:hypothetical protein
MPVDGVSCYNMPFEGGMMNPVVNGPLCSTVIVCVCSQPLRASQQSQPSPGTTSRISACSLLTREEVKKHLPWASVLDQLKTQEEALGTYGSACTYPSVEVQVMSFRQGTLDTVKKMENVEPVPGVGDEAYLRDNRGRYAELVVKVGNELLTLQANIPTGQKIDSVKPGVVSLATAMVPKLR